MRRAASQWSRDRLRPPPSGSEAVLQRRRFTYPVARVRFERASRVPSPTEQAFQRFAHTHGLCTVSDLYRGAAQAYYALTTFVQLELSGTRRCASPASGLARKLAALPPGAAGIVAMDVSNPCDEEAEAQELVDAMGDDGHPAMLCAAKALITATLTPEACCSGGCGSANCRLSGA